MDPLNLEARALALAHARGWVRLPAPDGAGLDELVAGGQLEGTLRDRLIWDALQEEGSGATYPASWTIGAWTPQDEEAATSPGPLRMTRFGAYESLELIGAGGQGRVYRAFDPRLRRHVALKLIHARRPEAHLREARAQAQVEHRNVCRVYEVGEAEGQPYIALQLIKGQPLGPGARDIKETVRLLRDAAEGVHAAHRQGLLHLDLKPANLLVSGEGGTPIVFVTDFGLADSEGTSRGPSGSPPYCAPEQVAVAPLDQRTDVYGLGTTLYAALTGHPPFEGSSLADLMLHIQHGEPEPPSHHSPAVPRDLEAIVLKAMAVPPGDRYATALAFADDLERWLKGMPILAKPSSWASQAAKWAKRNPAASLSLAALLLISCTAAARTARDASRRERQRILLEGFSEDMRTLELRLFAMRMLPPEDHRIIETDLRGRLARIEATLPDMGDLAPAGHYELGLGYRSLREWEPSARHFKAAWDSGFRTPDSAEATGIACGILTTVLSQQADSLPERERTAALAKIQKDWGDPGRKALATYEGTPQEPPYSAAMEAYHRKDYDAVFSHCLEALRRQPWQVGIWRFILTCAQEAPEAAARHGLAPDADGYSIAVRRLTLTAPGDAVSQDVLGGYWMDSANEVQGEARHARLLRAFTAFENARAIQPDLPFAFQRSLVLCADAAKAEPTRASEWDGRRRSVLVSAAKEPALADALRQAAEAPAP